MDIWLLKCLSRITGMAKKWMYGHLGWYAKTGDYTLWHNFVCRKENTDPLLWMC
jgi:hypothetical protein